MDKHIGFKNTSQVDIDSISIKSVPYEYCTKNIFLKYFEF